MIATIIRYDLRSVQNVDHENGSDYDVSHNENELEPYTITVWNEDKLGEQKTIAEYRAIGDLPQFKAWIRNWYRQRKIDHGNSVAEANRKTDSAYPE